MDLKNLLIAFTKDKEISIVDLCSNTQCIFHGMSSKFDCNQDQYEVVKFEKNHFDGSYSIVVINN